MSAAKKLHLVKNSDVGRNEPGLIEEENEVVEHEDMVMEILDDEQEEVGITAKTIARTLPTDVTLIVQKNSYTLEVLESYKHIISEDMAKSCEISRQQ